MAASSSRTQDLSSDEVIDSKILDEIKTIAHTVLKKCRDYESRAEMQRYAAAEAKLLCYVYGIPPEKFLEFHIPLNRWLSDIVLEESYYFPYIEEIDMIRKDFLDKYMKERLVPCEDNYKLIATMVKDKYSDLQFFKACKFQTQSVPNTKAQILIENPQALGDRVIFLKKMDEYRKENRKIVFLEERLVHKKQISVDNYILASDWTQCLMLYNSFNHTFVDFSIVTTKKVGNIDAPSRSLMAFIKLNLSKLPDNCVLVLGDKGHHTKTAPPLPTMFSSKTQMIEWLQSYGILHDPESHRAELFRLIDVHKTDLKAQYSIDSFLKLNGHDVLRRPYHCHMLNIFNNFWEMVDQQMCRLAIKESIEETKNNITQQMWIQEEKKLIELEKEALSEALEMEETVDRICTLAKYGSEHITKNNIKEIGRNPLLEYDRYLRKNVVTELDVIDRELNATSWY